MSYSTSVYGKPAIWLLKATAYILEDVLVYSTFRTNTHRCRLLYHPTITEQS